VNILHPTIQPVTPKRTPKNMVLGYRACHRDLRSRNGFRWAFPGQWTEAAGPFGQHDSACPIHEGDGICIARTLRGAGSGGIPGGTYLLVAYSPADVLGEDTNKVRVKRALTLDVFTFAAFIGPGADLWGADLRGANLRGANLRGAECDRFTVPPAGWVVNTLTWGLEVRLVDADELRRRIEAR